MRAPLDRELEPAERRLKGQHFTSSRVADLINAFCVRSGGDVVIDPACGSGALLLRARARLALLGGDGSTLRGMEVDPRLAAWARAGLKEAVIVTGDFLDPSRAAARALPPAGSVDAVVGNPPYVRQELIDAARKRRFAAGAPVPLSGRCDLHVYFWHRALALLKESGRLGFLTSASWLDAGYGEALRGWLARNFRIVALVESRCESWFDEARVRTVMAIVENSPPRDAGPARLARLDRPLEDVAPPGLAPAERLARFEQLARDIERGKDARPARPADLARQRWGALLRCPGLWPEIRDLAAGRFVPLSQVATVRWGIKSGDDAFFFLRHGGIGDSQVEARFLEPAVFNLMEVDRLVISAGRARRQLLRIDLRRHSIEGTAVQRRIRLARRRGSHRRPTCAARERAGGSSRRWFEIRPGPPGEILWSIMHQYRHLAPLNPEGLAANDNLLLIRALPDVPPRLLAALLNSHLQALIKLACGRQRNEGMIKTQAADVKQMPVPDPRQIGSGAARRILAAFDALARRRIGDVASECLRSDRRRLDLAVMRAVGFGPAESEDLVSRLYATLSAGQVSERGWERDAVRRRARSLRVTTADRRSASAPAGRGPGCRR